MSQPRPNQFYALTSFEGSDNPINLNVFGGPPKFVQGRSGPGTTAIQFTSAELQFVPATSPVISFTLGMAVLSFPGVFEFEGTNTGDFFQIGALSDGRLFAGRHRNNIVGTGPLNNGWNYVEITVTLGTMNATFQFRINENPGVVVNVPTGGTPGVDNFTISGGEVDDFYMLPGVGNFIGDINSVLLLARAAGSNSAWTPKLGPPNYAMANHDPPANGSWNSATAAPSSPPKDSYLFPSVAADAIYKVTADYQNQDDQSIATDDINPIYLYSGGSAQTEFDSGFLYPARNSPTWGFLNLTGELYPYSVFSNPASQIHSAQAGSPPPAWDPNPWTEMEVNSMEVGMAALT